MLAACPEGIRAGDVETFNSRLFDLQYFSRSAEGLPAGSGGWGNPAAWAEAERPELRMVSEVHFIDGATYGLEELIPPGPGNPEPIRRYETPAAVVTRYGVGQAVPLGAVPGVVAVRVDGLENDLDDNESSHIDQRGWRAGASYGVALRVGWSVGYEVVYFEDSYQWGVTWPHFVPGSELPRNVDYVLHSEGASWLQRIGLAGNVGEGLRVEATAEWGLGDTDNTWNGERTGGSDDMEHRGLEGGVRYAMRPGVEWTATLAWQSTCVEFGRHPSAIGHGGIAKWDAEVVRPAMGLGFAPAEGWEVQGGYRHNFFEVGDLCGHEADQNYGTVVAAAVLGKPEWIRVGAEVEHSFIEPGGEWAGRLSVQAMF